jgi:glutathione peroxidase
MSVFELPLTTLAGVPLDPATLRGRAVLVVNVASQCGLTPQYQGLQTLYQRYQARGLVVVGVPCDQFAGQEPGTAEEIAEFCAGEYAVSFPLTEKLEVNGQNRHPLYQALTQVGDRSGRAGDVEWNFEKFLVSPRGEPVARFRPTTLPDADELVAAISELLPGHAEPVWTVRLASEVEPGDRVLVPGRADGDTTELTVSRIEENFLGRDGLRCLIEDTPCRWLAKPTPAAAEVKVLA